MRLTKGVPTSHQRHGLLVVHRHPRKGLANVTTRGQHVRLSVRTFRVHIDQAHLHCGQRVLQITLTGVAGIIRIRARKPFRFRTPINVLFRLPHICTATGKAKGGATHALNRHVTCENIEVRPADLIAVFLLDRPQQATRLVEVAIIRPGVQRRKTLLPGAATATAVRCPVGAR